MYIDKFRTADSEGRRSTQKKQRTKASWKGQGQRQKIHQVATYKVGKIGVPVLTNSN